MEAIGNKNTRLAKKYSNRQALPSALSKARKATIMVTCSNCPPVAIELLIRVIGNTAYVGAKRPYKPQEGVLGAAAKLTTAHKLVFINGVPRECTVCGNHDILICRCGAFSCATNGANHTCPNCHRYIEAVHLTPAPSFEAVSKPRTVNSTPKNQKILSENNLIKLT